MDIKGAASNVSERRLFDGGEIMAASHAVKTEHWYYQRIFRCPICGLTKVSRKRRSGKRPKVYFFCYEITTKWCGECQL